MLKVLAAVLSVLSAAISITIYTATLPDIQKQAADNAAAIENNAEDIKDVENKTRYFYKISQVSTNFEAICFIVSKTKIEDFDDLKNYIFENGAQSASGFDHTTATIKTIYKLDRQSANSSYICFFTTSGDLTIIFSAGQINIVEI